MDNFEEALILATAPVCVIHNRFHQKPKEIIRTVVSNEGFAFSYRVTICVFMEHYLDVTITIIAREELHYDNGLRHANTPPPPSNHRHLHECFLLAILGFLATEESYEIFTASDCFYKIAAGGLRIVFTLAPIQYNAAWSRLSLRPNLTQSEHFPLRKLYTCVHTQ